MGDRFDSLVEALADFLERNKDALVLAILVPVIAAIVMGVLRHWWICLSIVLAGAGVFGLWWMMRNGS